MYYVLERDTRSAGKYVYFGEEPEEYNGGQWRTGAVMAPPVSAMTLVMDDKRTTRLSDMILNAADLQVYSPKLIETLAAAGVDNIQYFPIKIVDGRSAAIRDDYKVANIVGRIDCVDLEHSTVERSPRTKRIMSVEGFSVLEDRVVPLPDRKTPPLIFRLGELDVLILAHESLKRAFERDGITGARFTPTQDYVG
jgi:hypothetical protein